MMPIIITVNGDILIVLFAYTTFVLFAVFGVMLHDAGVLQAWADAESQPDRLDDLIAGKKERGGGEQN
jgi:hypothetical protein